MTTLAQPQRVDLVLEIENAELWAALQAELAVRGGAHHKTDGSDHRNTIAITLEALEAFLVS